MPLVAAEAAEVRGGEGGEAEEAWMADLLPQRRLLLQLKGQLEEILPWLP